MRTALLCLLTTLMFACVHGSNQSTDPQHIRGYEDEASQLLQSIQDKEPHERIVTQAKALANRGEGLVNGYMKDNPECVDYLNKSLEVLRDLEKLSEADISKHHHKNGVTPDAPQKCYHAKDLVIHPATVVILAKNEGPEQTEKMADQIREVLAHLKVFEKSITPAAAVTP